METRKINRSWITIVIFLLAIIVFGGIVISFKYTPSKPIEISLPQDQEWQGAIYISGDVNNPGIYTFTSNDSLEKLIQIAGGRANSANLSTLELLVVGEGEGKETQKIDINRAEAWLLEALPGIGETLAQHIVSYRRQNGPFRNIGELLNVAGIGPSTYERIKDLITASD